VPMNLRRVTFFNCFSQLIGPVSPTARAESGRYTARCAATEPIALRNESPSHQAAALSDDDLFDVVGERSRAPVVDHRVAAFVPALAQHTA
jgi:hypothetical protein